MREGYFCVGTCKNNSGLLGISFVEMADGSIHTKNHRPWDLILFLGFKNKLKATAFEKYLKSGSGSAFARKRFW